MKAARETMRTQAPSTRSEVTNTYNSLYVTAPTNRTKTVNKMTLIWSKARRPEECSLEHAFDALALNGNSAGISLQEG